MTKKNLQNSTPAAVLCILDGWGDRQDTENNAIALANTPNWDRFIKTELYAKLDASAESVGLPKGQMGNSEVGHMCIGSGRVIPQDLPRINTSIENGSLKKNLQVASFIKELKSSKGACHLFGLLSPGGVHSHQDHMIGLVEILSGSGIPICVHAVLDGRDSPPKSALGYLEKFCNQIARLDNCAIASISGRYWAMDRDSNWDRVQLAYETIMGGTGELAIDGITAIKETYKNCVTDEFVKPTVLGQYSGVKNGDGLLIVNFRADRVRQILSALVDPEFKGFRRTKFSPFSACLGMVEYSSSLNSYFKSIFPPIHLDGILGQVIAESGKRQLRIAETEKYAHVTFFLNGGREKAFSGEKRILIQSPRVQTYDLQPEMSAELITDKLVEAIISASFDLIIVNYANGDMVGHTGKLSAAIKAVNCIDDCLGRLERAVKGTSTSILITADHGNCEMMYDTNKNEPHTQHTLNKVPVMLINSPKWAQKLGGGSLRDIAPTMLDLLGLPRPGGMSGQSLIERRQKKNQVAGK